MGSEQELQQKQHQVFGWLLPPWCFFSSVVALHVSYAAGARSALTKQFPRAIPLKCQKKSRSGGVESVIYRATCYTLVSPIRLSIDELFFFQRLCSIYDLTNFFNGESNAYFEALIFPPPFGFVFLLESNLLYLVGCRLMNIFFNVYVPYTIWQLASLWKWNS